MPRNKYPSDDRRYVRVVSEGLADDTADLTDAEFRTFILALAWANEHKAHQHGDWIHIAKSRVQALAPNSRGSNAKSTRTILQLAAKQTWAVREEGARLSIHVRNYSQIQGFPPSKVPPDYDETPLPTPTPTLTPNLPPTLPRGGGDARPSRDDLTRPWLNFLKGSIPNGLNGQTWDTIADWFDHHYDILDAEAEGNARTKAAKANGGGDSVGWEQQYNAAFKSVLNRYWKNKAPKVTRSKSSRVTPTTTKGAEAWNIEEAKA